MEHIGCLNIIPSELEKRNEESWYNQISYQLNQWIPFRHESNSWDSLITTHNITLRSSPGLVPYVSRNRTVQIVYKSNYY